eukprot:COSAG01_NODE_1904_length_8947_cov_6.556962_7_plen_75_part_00
MEEAVKDLQETQAQLAALTGDTVEWRGGQPSSSAPPPVAAASPTPQQFPTVPADSWAPPPAQVPPYAYAPVRRL